MNKQEIIAFAQTKGFKLDHDRYDDKEYSNSSNPDLRYLRFVSTDDELDEPDLRWIWFKKDSDNDNIEYGQYIQSRLKKKREVLNSLKY
jgi:hypothetical protein